ncbi:hypothetical protein HK100_006219, partial [Physocladia obscura]
MNRVEYSVPISFSTVTAPIAEIQPPPLTPTLDPLADIDHIQAPEYSTVDLISRANTDLNLRLLVSLDLHKDHSPNFFTNIRPDSLATK